MIKQRNTIVSVFLTLVSRSSGISGYDEFQVQRPGYNPYKSGATEALLVGGFSDNASSNFNAISRDIRGFTLDSKKVSIKSPNLRNLRPQSQYIDNK